MDDGAFASGLLFGLISQDFSGSTAPVFEFSPPAPAIDETATGTQAMGIQTIETQETQTDSVDDNDDDVPEAAEKQYTKLVDDFVNGDSVKSSIARAAIVATQLPDNVVEKVDKDGLLFDLPLFNNFKDRKVQVVTVVESELNHTGFSITPPNLPTESVKKPKLSDSLDKEATAAVVWNTYVDIVKSGTKYQYVVHAFETRSSGFEDIANPDPNDRRKYKYDVMLNNCVYVLANVMQATKKDQSPPQGGTPALLKMRGVNFEATNVYTVNDGFPLPTAFQKTLALSKGWEWYRTNVGSLDIAKKIETMYILGQKADAITN